MTTSPYFYKGSGIPQVEHPKNSGLKYEVKILNCELRT